MRRTVALAAVLTAALSASSARAEGFTAAEFLRWSPESRTSYLRSSVSMAGVIAAQLKKGRATCIDEWFAKEDRAGYPAVMQAAQKYPNYHPQAVILWVLQNACGKITAEE